MAQTKEHKIKFDQDYTMHSKDYFRKLSETTTQPKKPDPAILAEKVRKFLSTPGKKITEVERGSSGMTLSPMGICRNGIKGAQK